jgi:hypothetical protein
MNKKLICALAMIGASTPVFADHGRHEDSMRDSIDARQSRIEQRMEQGRRSGELTRNEYVRLRNEMRHIARDEHAFRADGHLSPRERQNLNARLDVVAQAVRYEVRDGERRGQPYNDHHADRRY